MSLEALKGARIAFDLDGTLVDTAPDLLRALNDAITPAGLAPVPLAAVRAMVGRGAKALILRAHERAGLPEPGEAALAERLEHFLKSYSEGIADQSAPFDGVEAALDMLTSTGAEVSVCTNKPTWLAVPLLEAVGLKDRFARIIGAEDAPAKKPDPRHLEAALGGPADRRCVLVGDSEPDVLAAKAAGAWSVIYIDGYSEKPAGALGADRLFQNFDALPGALAELVAQA